MTARRAGDPLGGPLVVWEDVLWTNPGPTRRYLAEAPKVPGIEPLDEPPRGQAWGPTLTTDPRQAARFDDVAEAWAALPPAIRQACPTGVGYFLIELEARG